jgi:hypothetical protein
LGKPKNEEGEQRYQQDSGQHEAHASHQKLGKGPDDQGGQQIFDRINAGKEGDADSEQDDAYREEKVIEPAHESEAFIVGAFGARLPAADKLLQRIKLRGRNDAISDGRFEVVIVNHHSLSTVTLRLV